jgi:hypothetical protein
MSCPLACLAIAKQETMIRTLLRLQEVHSTRHCGFEVLRERTTTTMQNWWEAASFHLA